MGDEREDLIDLLLDLEHDLAKYLAMPFGFLPAGAQPDEVRCALSRALLATQQGSGGTRPARALWAQFVAVAPAALRRSPRYAVLETAVETALAWERCVRPLSPAGGPPADLSVPLDRAAIERDLRAVSPAIRDLINHLNHLNES